MKKYLLALSLCLLLASCTTQEDKGVPYGDDGLGDTTETKGMPYGDDGL